MVRIKICGITNIEDALAAVTYGADALGFIFAESPRRVTPAQARDIIARLPPFVTTVGVFVDADPDAVSATRTMCQLDFVQLHGAESPAYCESLSPRAIKAFRVKDDSVLGILPHYRATAYLLDAGGGSRPGGNGIAFDWAIARRATQHGPIILSGGLNADNVAQAIAVVQPCAVDVCSGIEAQPGLKDHERMHSFIAAVKAGEAKN